MILESKQSGSGRDLGFALKRSAYGLTTIDSLVDFLHELFLVFDIVLLDYEGWAWKVRLDDFATLATFLAQIDPKKRLIYTHCVRARGHDEQLSGKAISKFLLDFAKQIPQFSLCLVAGHKAYLGETVDTRVASAFGSHLDLMTELDGMKEWYLGCHNILRLASRLSKRFKNMSLIFLKSKNLLNEFQNLKGVPFSKRGVYGLWIFYRLNRDECAYFSRRGVNDLSLDNSEVNSYILTQQSFKNVPAGTLFLFSASL